MYVTAVDAVGESAPELIWVADGENGLNSKVYLTERRRLPEQIGSRLSLAVKLWNLWQSDSDSGVERPGPSTQYPGRRAARLSDVERTASLSAQAVDVRVTQPPGMPDAASSLASSESESRMIQVASGSGGHHDDASGAGAHCQYGLYYRDYRDSELRLARPRRAQSAAVPGP